MNIKLSILLLLIAPFLAKAQTSQTFDIVTGLDYSYRTLTSPFSLFELEAINDLNEIETPQLDYRIGFNYNRLLAKNFHFKTGVRFARFGYRTDTGNFQFPNQHDGMGGFAGNTSNENPKIGYDFYFVELPIVARYELKKEKFVPFFEMGVAPQFLVNSNASFRITTNMIFNQESFIYRNFNVLSIASVGMNYKFREQVQLFAQASFRYQLRSLVQGNFNEYLYNGGLEFGIRKTIGKMNTAFIFNRSEKL